MNPFVALDSPPVSLQMLQLALVFTFLTSYSLVLGSFVGPRGKVRATGIALVALAAFSATLTTWAMGIVWAALAVGAMGGFVALTLVTSRLLRLDGRRVVLPAPALVEETASAPPRRAPVAVHPAYTVPGRL